MTLTHLFKAQAIFAWIWVLMFWLFPSVPAESFGFLLADGTLDPNQCDLWSGSIGPNTRYRYYFLDGPNLGW